MNIITVIESRKKWFFPATVFLSAFLLFQIQPLLGKYISPWFGGSPAVWTTCMLFFQVFLLGGYSYSHILSRMELRTQGRIHIIVITCSLVLILILSFLWETSITPGSEWKPSGSELPIWHILRLLFISIGLPFFLLSSTSSLIQSWFSRSGDGRSPYSFYALSNSASFLALISYPVVFEPFFTLTEQAELWTCLYIIYALILIYIAAGIIKSTPEIKKREKESAQSLLSDRMPASKSPGGRKLLIWVGLAACGSVLLLAVTNQMCQDLSVIPFLWILPLSLYLFSFMVCFNDKPFYSRSWFPLLVIAALFLGWWNLKDEGLSIFIRIAVYSFTLLVCCIFCHGELYSRKPDPRHLTLFYLMISIGGALGGFFVNLIAPVVFKGYWEYHFGLIVCAVILVLVLFENKEIRLYRLRFLLAILSLIPALLLVVISANSLSDQVEISRGFYGVLRIRQAVMGDSIVNGLMHGSVFHGWQADSGPYHKRPTTYYTENSGIGLALNNHPKHFTNQSMSIGVIGLGIGTLSVYGRKGDVIRFYEIDSNVIRMARDKRYFTYLSDTGARVDIVQGDARLSLEREPAQDYDVLVVDAFTGDAIPIHLLTGEAFEIYLSHLTADGILAFHITNRYIDLVPVLWALKSHFAMDGLVVKSVKDSDAGMTSVWVLLTNNRDFLNVSVMKKFKQKPGQIPSVPIWTDDFSNLYQALR